MHTERAIETNSGTSALPNGYWKAIRPLDALLFSLFLFDRTAVGGVAPAGVLLSLVIIGIGMFRRPVYRVRNHGLIAMAFLLILLWLTATSMVNGVDFSQRLLRIAILFVLALILMEGRFHWFSAIAGLAISMTLVNIPAYYLGLTPDQYPPYLTGFFVDKNVAGLWYALILVLGLWVFRTPKARFLWLVLAAGALFLTGSRTSMSAAAVGLLWFFFRDKLSWFFRLLLGAGLVSALNYAEEELARMGIFSDREGTDWFREQISIAMDAKAELTPWFGQGLTTSFVDLGGTRGTFLFHDSFLALRVEGGYPLLIAIVAFFALAGAGLLDQRIAVPLRVRVGEAACLVVLVCAWKLGEVFFTSISFTTLGFAMWARFAESIKDADPRVFMDAARRALPVDVEDPIAPVHREALSSPVLRNRDE